MPEEIQKPCAVAPRDLLCRVLRLLPISKEKLRLALVSKAWKEAMLDPNSHADRLTGQAIDVRAPPMGDLLQGVSTLSPQMLPALRELTYTGHFIRPEVLSNTFAYLHEFQHLEHVEVTCHIDFNDWSALPRFKLPVNYKTLSITLGNAHNHMPEYFMQGVGDTALPLVTHLRVLDDEGFPEECWLVHDWDRSRLGFAQARRSS
ncbi:hypothetical protein WJX73_002404 [Symbiochloris irregularis]|uniref:F-box domain-containing protein n=1 Tax=Symbiochloris irregularis TaxID=706552 RepID=A0AAW1NQY8_9CHLO